MRNSLVSIAGIGLPAIKYGVFTRGDRRGDRSRDRSPRRSHRV